MLNEKTWDYVRQHATEDVRSLALQGTRDPAVVLPQALQQIAGWQTARQKLPSWATVEGVVYPPHLNMEQCSSELTARYKAGLLKVGQCHEACLSKVRQRYVDLTGGLGVDFYFMSQDFQERCYVEQNDALCAIAEHNFQRLGLASTVNQTTAEAFLADMQGRADIVYLDPARRDGHGGRTYGIADCTPNVLELMPLLQQKANSVVLKLSPMLDWRKAVSDLNSASDACLPSTDACLLHVAAVHIVSVDNECKELVVEMRGDSQMKNEKSEMRNENEEMKNEAAALRVVCVDIKSKDGMSVFSYEPKEQERREAVISHSSFLIPHFLYEPNASIMKAGCFAEVGQRYGISQLAPNSHLFAASDEIEDFPGRGFHIAAVSSMNKQELKAALRDIERANISVRNFPMTPEQLRKKLRLKDGGDVYIFATTVADSLHRLYICRKIG